jgi:Acetyltransferase (GNAT) domain
MGGAAVKHASLRSIEMSQLVPVDEVLLDHILDGTHQLWHDGLARQPYARLWRAQLATAWGRRCLTRWALVDGAKLLCSAKLYTFDALLDRRPIKIAGIGAVFTPVPERGHGAAATLLERLIDHASHNGYDAALLFSEIGPDYYARFGFVAVALADLTVLVVEDDRRGAPAMMVRSGEDRDLADIVSLDAARAAAGRFHLERDRDLVKFSIARRRLHAGLADPGERELQFFIVEEGASAVAYVVVSVKGEEWTIDSCGDRDPAGARLGGLLQVLVAREPSRRRPTIKAWLPEGLRPPQWRIVDASPSRDVMMIRPLSERGTPAPPLAASDIVYWRGDAF